MENVRGFLVPGASFMVKDTEREYFIVGTSKKGPALCSDCGYVFDKDLYTWEEAQMYFNDHTWILAEGD